jgi:hypothetical protein
MAEMARKSRVHSPPWAFPANTDTSVDMFVFYRIHIHFDSTYEVGLN